MDSSNIRDMHFAFDSDPEGKIRLLLDYTEHSRNIADPGIPVIFRRLGMTLTRGCDALLTDLGFI